MTTLDWIISAVRTHPGIKELEGSRATGAEGYLQGFAHIADSRPSETSARKLRWIAWQYLLVTASLPEGESPQDYRAGARFARKLVKDLQRTSRRR